MPAKARGRGQPTRGTRSGGSRSSTVHGGAPAQERELRAQGRKTMRRLLDAGRTVFEQRGFHAARVDDIVRMARTSHGTFYLYFANKEDLYKALAFDAMADMAGLADSLGPVTPDPAGREVLRAWVAQFCDTYARHGTVIRSLTESAALDAGLLHEGISLLGRLAATLSRRMEEAGVDADMDVGVAGLACLSMIERFNYFSQAGQAVFDRDDMVETLTTAAHTGFFGGTHVLRPAGRLRRAARR